MQITFTFRIIGNAEQGTLSTYYVLNYFIRVCTTLERNPIRKGTGLCVIILNCGNSNTLNIPYLRTIKKYVNRYKYPSISNLFCLTLVFSVCKVRLGLRWLLLFQLGSFQKYVIARPLRVGSCVTRLDDVHCTVFFISFFQQLQQLSFKNLTLYVMY